jgi:hypothetical protein
MDGTIKPQPHKKGASEASWRPFRLDFLRKMGILWQLQSGAILTRRTEEPTQGLTSEGCLHEIFFV